MRRICVTGHRPDSFIVSHYNLESVKRIVEDAACALKREHGGDLEMLLGGAIGIDQMMGSACIEHGIRYSLFLPFHPDIQGSRWSPAQRTELSRQVSRATGLTMADPVGPYDPRRYHERDRMMVDGADFVLAFWVGKRRGGTWGTMRYALESGKLVANAMDGMRLVFREDLERGWTPPHLREGDDA